MSFLKKYSHQPRKRRRNSRGRRWCPLKPFPRQRGPVRGLALMVADATPSLGRRMPLAISPWSILPSSENFRLNDRITGLIQVFSFLTYTSHLLTHLLFILTFPSDREVFLNFLLEGNIGKSTIQWGGTHLCNQQCQEIGRYQCTEAPAELPFQYCFLSSELFLKWHLYTPLCCYYQNVTAAHFCVPVCIDTSLIKPPTPVNKLSILE